MQSNIVVVGVFPKVQLNQQVKRTLEAAQQLADRITANVFEQTPTPQFTASPSTSETSAAAATPTASTPSTHMPVERELVSRSDAGFNSGKLKKIRGRRVNDRRWSQWKAGDQRQRAEHYTNSRRGSGLLRK